MAPYHFDCHFRNNDIWAIITPKCKLQPNMTSEVIIEVWKYFSFERFKMLSTPYCFESRSHLNLFNVSFHTMFHCCIQCTTPTRLQLLFVRTVREREKYVSNNHFLSLFFLQQKSFFCFVFFNYLVFTFLICLIQMCVHYVKID